MASSDAKPVPVKNVAYRVIFPIFDADGDLVTGAAGLDSEVSKDQGTFADCTNEATEIATSSGMYYLDLTSTEMDADCVAVIVKTTTTGAKTTPLVLYPQETGDIKVDVTSYGGTTGTFSSGRPEVNTTHLAGTSQTGRDIGASVLLSAGTGTGQLDFTSGVVKANTTQFGGSAITSASGIPEVKVQSVAANALTASALASDAVAEIADGVWDEAQSGHTTAGTFGKYLDTEVSGVSGGSGLDAAGVRAAIGLASANLDTQLSGIAGYIDTEVAAIKAVTDKIDTALESDGVSGYQFTTLALENGPTGTSLDAAGVRAAVGLASANLDTQLSTIDTVVDAVKAKTDNLPASPAATGDAMTLASAAITTATFAAGAIDANAIATDAFGALELAAGAASEIAAAVVDQALSGHTSSGSVGEALSLAGTGSMATAGSDPTATPGPTATYGEKVDWMFAKAANEQTQTTTLQTVAKSDGTVISQAPITSDGTTVTREVFADP